LVNAGSEDKLEEMIWTFIDHDAAYSEMSLVMAEHSSTPP
jgi:hypothetical protein